MKQLLIQRLYLFICLTTLIVLFQNCSTDYSVDLLKDEPTPLSIEPPVVVKPPIIDDVDDDDVICDPFETENTQVSDKHGIVSELFYIDTPNTRASRYQEVVSKGVKSPKRIYLNDINVQSRRFTEGFTTQSSEKLVKANGDTLIEWFGLNMSSQIRLGQNENAGLYELAVLSDDGALLYLQEPNSNQLNLHINNDGIHGVKMGCSSGPISLQKNQKIAFNLKYYQGPRDHIAAILLWRPHSDQNERDPLCGETSTHDYFNLEGGSTPYIGPYYNQLLARGWRPLKPENFILPDTMINPCTQ